MIVFIDFLNEVHCKFADELVCETEKLKSQLAENYREIYFLLETGDIIAAKTFEGKLLYSHRIENVFVKNVKHANKLLKVACSVNDPSIRGLLLAKKLDIV